MLPTPVLSVSGKGFARLRISAWHFSPAPPILYAVRAIVYHKSRVLSRVLRDFSGGKAPGTPGAEPARHWLALPIRHPAGGVPSESPTRRKTDRTAFLLAVPAAKERGDRGRGTIRRKRRRRLRWSSPPGQGKQVPRGFSSPPPRRTPQRQGQPAPPGAEGAPPIPPSDACKNRKIMVKPSPE